MKRKLFYILALFSLLTGCQKNDICTEGTPATPKLVIHFFDNDLPLVEKEVEGFNARVLDSSEVYLSSPITDVETSVPLNTQKNSTTYVFYEHYGDSLTQRTDTLKFTYGTDEVYINRACGFKDDFVDFDADLIQEDPTDSWIKDLRIVQDTIANNEKAHLFIYH